MDKTKKTYIKIVKGFPYNLELIKNLNKLNYLNAKSKVNLFNFSYSIYTRTEKIHTITKTFYFAGRTEYKFEITSLRNKKRFSILLLNWFDWNTLFLSL